MVAERDLSGMSDEDALAQATRDVDRGCQYCIDQYREWLVDHGASPAEIEAEMIFKRNEMAEFRRDKIKELRSWLGISLH
jgi:hypothetical protein